MKDDAIAKFQRLYKIRFGKEVSKNDALKMGLGLVGLVRCLLEHGQKQVLPREMDETDLQRSE